jgi:hypothetical protein
VKDGRTGLYKFWWRHGEQDWRHSREEMENRCRETLLWKKEEKNMTRNIPINTNRTIRTLSKRNIRNILNCYKLSEQNLDWIKIGKNRIGDIL